MSLTDLIHGNGGSGKFATATLVTFATSIPQQEPTVAPVAIVNVAISPEPEITREMERG